MQFKLEKKDTATLDMCVLLQTKKNKSVYNISYLFLTNEGISTDRHTHTHMYIYTIAENGMGLVEIAGPLCRDGAGRREASVERK